MVSPEGILEELRMGEISLSPGVPDSLLKNLTAYLSLVLDTREHIITPNEGSAIAVGAGHYIATGTPALVYMQNSGLGNAVNPILSLVDRRVYAIPMLLLIGWRGEPSTYDEPQHLTQGEATVAFLDAMGIGFDVLDERDDVARRQLRGACAATHRSRSPHAILIRRGTIRAHGLATADVEVPALYPIRREFAIEAVASAIGDKGVVFSTTGMASRELYELRVRQGEAVGRDFLSVGSMGHVSMIALGFAMAQEGREVYCLDGDGSFLMHMGAVSAVGLRRLPNYHHIVLNNGAHQSVGGLPTAGFDVDLCGIAKACGYAETERVVSPGQLAPALERLIAAPGPSLLEIRLNTEARQDVGRPATTPRQNLEALMTIASQ